MRYARRDRPSASEATPPIVHTCTLIAYTHVLSECEHVCVVQRRCLSPLFVRVCTWQILALDNAFSLDIAGSLAASVPGCADARVGEQQVNAAGPGCNENATHNLWAQFDDLLRHRQTEAVALLVGALAIFRRDGKS